MRRYLHASVTRITDFEQVPFEVHPLARDRWETADYVLAEVLGPSHYPFEIANGRLVDAVAGDLVVGALGKRAATLEVVGDWGSAGATGEMHALTGAGLFGLATSLSTWLRPLTPIVYRGHVTRGDRKLNMRDFVRELPPAMPRAPMILLIGTSMSAGKTTTARVVVRMLAERGLQVLAAKLTGAARYRDILSCLDVGAEHVLDFVDAGLPSTVCPESVYAPALEQLLARMAALDPDVIVAEAGASPLEPYNGTVVYRRIADRVKLCILCASDPYAVLGVQDAFQLKPDLVAGPAANTTAAVELVARLTGVRALNLLERSGAEELRMLLDARIVPSCRH
jgi:molybdopterin-guanine dinucleotide biosynthesis protein